jgi:hypothetical protein
MDDQRPARPIRIAVLALAITCLGLAMCTRTQSSSTQQPPVNRGGAKTAATPADAAPAPPPDYYFSATKAPGPIYEPPQAQPPQQAVQH